MEYKYEGKFISLLDRLDEEEREFVFRGIDDELKEVYAKARAFDNYMVDLVKSVETYPYDYKRNNNFAKETYDFYMQSKEDFIEAYKKDVSQRQELIESVEEYDRIIEKLEEMK